MRKNNDSLTEVEFYEDVYGVKPLDEYCDIPERPRDPEYERAIGDYEGFYFVGEYWERYREIFERKRRGE